MHVCDWLDVLSIGYGRDHHRAWAFATGAVLARQMAEKGARRRDTSLWRLCCSRSCLESLFLVQDVVSNPFFMLEIPKSKPRMFRVTGT